MILCGREIQALRAGMLIILYVPFARTAKQRLSSAEEEQVGQVREKLRAASAIVCPRTPRNTPGWQEQMLENRAEVLLTKEEVRLMMKILAACLAELEYDVEVSVQGGPGVGLDAMRTVYSKLADEP